MAELFMRIGDRRAKTAGAGRDEGRRGGFALFSSRQRRHIV